MKDLIKELSEKLPKQPYILDHEEAVHTAVLIPLVQINKETYILFEIRAPHIKQGGEVCFPGGKVEDSDSSYRQAAIRETVEELGVLETQIQIIGQMDSVLTTQGIYVHGFIGTLNIDNLNRISIDKNEVEQVFLMPLSYLIKHPPEVYQVSLELKSMIKDELEQERVLFPVETLKIPKRYHENWSGGLRNIYVYQFESKVIWGITAQFLRGLSRFLG